VICRSCFLLLPARHGFTLVELMVAIVVLTVGVLTLVGSSAMATRMIGRGGRGIEVAMVASGRTEQLRRLAAGSTPRCGGLTDGTSRSVGGVVERWNILGAAGDPAREVRLTLDYRVPAGPRTDTVTVSLDCR
jgi:prepilin-type N-terminal cleavage/methylation domain-containing protein